MSSVVSNVSASSADSTASDSTLKTLPQDKATTTKITIHGHLPAEDARDQSLLGSHSRKTSKASNATQKRESVLLTLYPQTHSVASEWLDGLLMLLNQQPITAETNNLVSLVSNWGMRLRLLNVRYDDPAVLTDAPNVPSREGLDEDYYYQL